MPSRERDQEKTLASSAIAPGYEAPRGRATRAARPEGGLTVSAGSGRKGPDEPSAARKLTPEASARSLRQKLTKDTQEGRMDTRDPSPTTPLPLTRREALAALAAAGGYALSASPIAAQAIKTDSQGLVEGTVRVAGADQTPIPVYEAYPAKEGEFPVIVVISEVWGLHEY